MPLVFDRGAPALFGPRKKFTRGKFSNLRKAMGIVNRERQSRAGGQGFWGLQTGEQINQAGRDWPRGFGEAHGGRSVPEVERDTFLNSLTAARGMQPTTPQTHRSFVGDWAAGVSERANERYRAGGYY